ncbi:MAG: ABC transporter ATP-binding protein [Candidatus Latescibacterota bacterium]
MTSNYAVETSQLTRSFGNRDAVRELTLAVAPGEIFGLLGPNGSGKTTTIRMLLGLIAPSSGEAHVLGCDVKSASQQIRERTGALMEHDGLYERLSARENLSYFARIYGIGKDAERTRISELLHGMGLSDRGDEPVSRWSKGMKRKLAMARALVHDPRMVFLDEPTSGLDPLGAKEVRDTIRKMAGESGKTFFLCTHNLNEAERLCSRVGVLHRGKLIACGGPEEIRADVSCPVIRLGVRGANGGMRADIGALAFVKSVKISGEEVVVELDDLSRTGEVVRFLAGRGADIYRVEPVQRSLEEVFLELVGGE